MWDVARPAEQSAGVREIDDCPLRSSPPRRGRLRAEERCTQICIQRGVPDFFSRRNHASREKIGGAIHQNVEPPEMFPGFIEQALNFRNLAKVCGNGKRPPSELFYFPDGILSLRLRTPIVDDHVRA